MTICKVCWIDKVDTIDNWYYHNWKRRWLKCRECTIEWRKSEHERELARERDRKRYHNNPNRRKYISDMWNKRRKEKWYNWIHLRAARRIAKLWIRPNTCPICWDKTRIVSHHPDYSKPYEIVFCCQICHDKIHRNKIECPTPIKIN